jgi:ABC-type amino acid transport substrate-binding protein
MPGFGYLNTKTGEMEGLDVELCRAVAAAATALRLLDRAGLKAHAHKFPRSALRWTAATCGDRSRARDGAACNHKHVEHVVSERGEADVFFPA